MSAPYADAAALYRAAGWAGVLPLPAGKKKLPPVGFTGHEGLDPDDEQVATWVKESPSGNIALRLPKGVIALDLDLYKDGAREAWEAIEAELGELPPTWVSTSRTDGSGKRLFRVPPGTLRAAFPWGEIVQHHHRYVMAAPSVNGSDGGKAVRWISPDEEPLDLPCPPEELPELPAAWVEYLQKKEPKPPEDVLRPLVAALPSEWAPPVATAVAAYGVAQGSRHDAMTSVTLRLANYAQAKYPGAEDALAQIEEAYPEKVADTRTQRVAEGEVSRAIEGARDKAATSGNLAEWVAPEEYLSLMPPKESEGASGGHEERPKPAPGELPDAFWDARPALTHIRQAAWHSGNPAEPVLGCVLARYVADQPFNIELPGDISKGTGLGIFVTMAGPSGDGKGTSRKLARQLLGKPHLLTTATDDISLGTRQGLADILFKKEVDPEDRRKSRKVRGAWNALIYVDEMERLAVDPRQWDQNSPAIDLRSIFTSDPWGQANANEETRRNIAGSSYVISKIGGIQPDKAGPLFADVGGGTPQRELWVTTQGYVPEPPDLLTGYAGNRPADPGPLVAPSWRPDTLTEIRVVPEGEVRHVLHAAVEVRNELVQNHHKRRERKELDKHRDLIRLKVAAALCLLDGRLGISVEDWRLAGMVIDASDETRSQLIEHAAQSRADQRAASNREYGDRAVAVEDALETRSPLSTVTRWLVTHVCQDDRWWTHKVLRDAAPRNHRPKLRTAMVQAAEEGKVETEEVTTWTGSVSFRCRCRKRS